MDGVEGGCEAGERSGGGGGMPTEKKEGPMRFFGERETYYSIFYYFGAIRQKNNCHIGSGRSVHGIMRCL